MRGFDGKGPPPAADPPQQAVDLTALFPVFSAEVERKVETRASSEWTPYQHQPLGLSRSDVPRRVSAAAAPAGPLLPSAAPSQRELLWAEKGRRFGYHVLGEIAIPCLYLHYCICGHITYTRIYIGLFVSFFR